MNRNQAASALREGEFEQAEALYREILSKDEKDEAARLGLSFALLKQRKLQGALDEAGRVLSANRNSARARALIGAAFLAGGEFKFSGVAFRNALMIDADEALAVAGLAMIDFYENRTSDSLNGLRRAARLDAREPDYLFNLAQAAARSERYAEAADAYERFLRVAPRSDAERRARIRGLIDFLRYLGAQKGLYQVTSDRRVSVPFDLNTNRPVLTVRINDRKEPLRFVLDTGSGMCVVSETAAQRLGLRAVARGGQARAVGGGGRFDIVYGFLQSLRIGGTDEKGTSEARISNVPVYVRPFPDHGEPVDGYLGLGALSKFLTTIDYSKSVMILQRTDGKNEIVDEATSTARVIEVPIRVTSSGFWSGEVKLDGVERSLNFIVDTGASVSVVSEELMQVEKLERWMQTARMRVYGAAGVAENVPVLLLPQVALGAHTHKQVLAAVLNLDTINETAGFVQTGIIGGNILRNFRLTFDFSRSTLRLEPNTNADLAPTVIPTAITSAKPKTP